MIHADTQSNTSLATLRDKGLQLTIRGAVVTRIDTHLIDISRRNRSHLGYKVNIGHDSRRVAIFTQLGHYIFEILALLTPLRRKTHNACTSIGYALGLRHA